MKVGRKFLILLFIDLKLLAQPSAVPLSTFDMQLEERIGPGASVSFFVAHASHLYFACSGAHGTVVIQTDVKGAFQRSTPLGIQKMAGFDIDEDGNLYALSDDSWLTVFYSTGGIQKTLRLDPKVLAFALVGGKTMVADEENRLGFLENDGPKFTLSAWPRPWTIFRVGSDRVGIWRPEGATISVLQREDGISTRGLDRATKVFAAVGDAKKHLYLLSTGKQARSVQIQEFDEGLQRGWTGNFLLPEVFQPQFMGVSPQGIYLVDNSGRAVIYSIDSPGMRFLVDGDPELLTDLTRFRSAVNATGCKNSVILRLSVGSDGVPKTIRIQSPDSLSNNPDVIAAIQAFHFRPKIEGGAAVTSSVTLEIGH